MCSIITPSMGGAVIYPSRSRISSACSSQISGTANSGAKLHVAGALFADGNLGLGGRVFAEGIGAQALREVIPEAVTRGESGYLLVNNDPVMWAMLNAIKEQQQQIEKLRTGVRRLRATRFTDRAPNLL